jgi:large repetitive protein
VLEPDCDGDGFGDETQDSEIFSCDDSPPDTTILKGPQDKTKKKTATFEFSGSDARAIAGFECSLDGAAFTACTSPHTVKVKKGKHTFSVRAVDDSANIDASPATDDWKVKRKKKK